MQKSGKRIGRGVRVGSLALLIGWCFAHALQGAVINFTVDTFDDASDISLSGNFLEAVNLGSGTAVTVNGVVFSPDVEASTFLASGGTDFSSSTLYQGGAVAGMTNADTQALLDSVEFGPGVGNSLARFDGLHLGHKYIIQILLVDDRPGNGGVTSSFGYSNPTGDLTEIYTLTGVDHSANSPQIITGSFIANEFEQDLHFQLSVAGNGMAQAFLVRSLTLPEPSTVGLLGLSLMTTLYLRKKK